MRYYIFYKSFKSICISFFYSFIIFSFYFIFSLISNYPYSFSF
nr:MAG TPA: hypothetical protein [Caudoviricetes sp.]